MNLNNEYLLSKQASRLLWLDVLKGLGIIFVAVGHIYQNKIVFNWLYSFHMPLFFFAAGWVYKEKEVVSTIKHRLFTIVVPYLSFGFMTLLYWQIIERKFRSSDMSFAESFVGLLRGQYSLLDFNVHLWFLPAFFSLVVLYNILMRKCGRKITYMVCGLLSIVYVLIELPELPWGLDRICKFVFFYAVGNILAEYGVKSLSRAKRVVAGIGLVVINFALSYFGLTNSVMWFVTASIGIAGFVLLSDEISEWSETPVSVVSSALQYFGRISLIVLCIHGPVYRIIAKVLAIVLHTETDAVRENFITAMLIVAITMAVCSIGYEIISRICPWMLGKMLRDAKNEKTVSR